MDAPMQPDTARQFGVSRRASEVASLLSSLRLATDAVSDAVRAHRRDELLPAIAFAGDLAAQLRAAIEGLDASDRLELAAAGVPRLAAALDAAARRNAFLIERAWATDAALMRLLMTAGQPSANSFGAQYGQAHGPSYVDREA